MATPNFPAVTHPLPSSFYLRFCPSSLLSSDCCSTLQNSILPAPCQIFPLFASSAINSLFSPFSRYTFQTPDSCFAHSLVHRKKSFPQRALSMEEEGEWSNKFTFHLKASIHTPLPPIAFSWSACSKKLLLQLPAGKLSSSCLQTLNRFTKGRFKCDVVLLRFPNLLFVSCHWVGMDPFVFDTTYA